MQQEFKRSTPKNWPTKPPAGCLEMCREALTDWYKAKFQTDNFDKISERVERQLKLHFQTDYVPALK